MVQHQETIFIRFLTNVRAFSNAMKMPLTNFRKIHDSTGKLNKTFQKNGTLMGKLGLRTRALSHGMRGFRMEMLGVMFFGMGLQRFFTGLLKPALELTGIFELWSSVLAILFLPIALAILDFLMPFLDWIINLSDETKLFIGKMVLLAAALSAALFLFGMFALGIGSVILAFGGLFVIIDRLIPDVNVLGVNMSSFVEAGLAISLLTGAFTLFKGVVGSLIDQFFRLDFVKAFLDSIGIKVDDSKEGWEKFRDVVSQIWVNIQDAWSGIELTVGKEKLPLNVWIRYLQTRFHQFITNLKNDNEELIDSFKDLSSSITNFMESIDIDESAKAINNMARAINFLASTITTLKGALYGIYRAYMLLMELPLSMSGGHFPPGTAMSRQIGGYIPHEGLYHLHAGETVVPNGDTFNSNPTINVYGATSGDLISQISEAVRRDLASLARR